MDQLRGFAINSAPGNFDLQRDLPSGFLELFLPLHQRFTPRQRELVAKRKRVLAEALGGKLPNHLPASEATTGNWNIALPDWCQDQRNQMTGPADDAELVVKMLNSGAPGVMLDLEDSTANLWDHLELGVSNIHAALWGELSYFDKKRNKQVAINESKTVIFTRARGLHLSQRLPGLGVLSSNRNSDQQRKSEFSAPDAGESNTADLAAASVYDVCRIAFGVEPGKLKLPDLLVSICHRRGALAIGGMTALYPDRSNPELNARALAVLEKDKKNESERGFDGAWTGHPDQNQIAVDQFPFPNQINTHEPAGERYPNLRPKPTGVGKRTLSGTRAAVRTVIRYRNGVLNGKGASLLDGYMEDLATDRIYRLMIAQRMKHSGQVEILDDSGMPVRHTPELIRDLFNEELDRLLSETAKNSDSQMAV